MPKYRLLTNEELKTFEKEFIEYLVINGITANDWVKIKEKEPEKAEKIIELFSDVILEGILRRIDFMEIRTQAYVGGVQCLTEKMILVLASRTTDSIDLLKENQTNLENLELHKAEKKYKSTREEEIFEMTKKGYVQSDGKLFKELLLLSVSET